MSTPPSPDAPSRYLRYLPAIYSKGGPAFVGRYLKIFEKILTGIDDSTLDGQRGMQELLAADVIGNLFYPRLSFLFEPSDTTFIPPISGATPEQKRRFSRTSTAISASRRTRTRPSHSRATARRRIRPRPRRKPGSTVS